MTVTHTWIVQGLTQLNDQKGTVCKVSYNIESKDGKIKFVNPRDILLNTENIGNFIPYQNLTEEIVLNWIKESLGEERISQIEKYCEDNVNRLKNSPAPSTISTQLPWPIENIL